MANAGGGAAGEGEWLKVAQLRALVQAQEEDHRAKVSPGPTRFPSLPFPSPRLIFLFAPCVRPSAGFDLCRSR
jgi:hypothetical protein